VFRAAVDRGLAGCIGEGEYMMNEESNREAGCTLGEECTRYAQECIQFVRGCSQFVRRCNPFAQGCNQFAQGCNQFAQGCNRFAQGCNRYQQKEYNQKKVCNQMNHGRKSRGQNWVCNLRADAQTKQDSQMANEMYVSMRMYAIADVLS